MTAVVITLPHLVVTAAKLCGPGGVRAVIAENLLLRQQLIVLSRPRQRAPNLTSSERVLCGLESIFLRPGRIHKVAIGVRPSTLLAFHQALVRRKYRRLFSSSRRHRKPGPKGPNEALIRAIVELKSRNPRFGCPRMARIISRTFGVDIDKNVVYRVLSKHYRPSPGGAGPSWRSFIGHMADSLWSVATFPYEPILLHSYWVRVVLYHCTRGREGLCGNARDRECELAVQKFSSSCIDEPFYEEMRRWHMRHGVDVIDLEPPRIRGPAFILEQRVMISTEMPRCVSSANGLAEHAAEAGADYHAACRSASFEGNAPFRVAVGSTLARAELDDVRWASPSRGLVQLPMAA